jgi:hypothetical protein
MKRRLRTQALRTQALGTQALRTQALRTQAIGDFLLSAGFKIKRIDAEDTTSEMDTWGRKLPRNRRHESRLG